ncbi:hypothetical protein [Nitratireductor sp. OM-1]|uniref:hypothetical protein n=1 Tax=Nitratireductor sp. OM-1 TaxID=1756988 RepID=UPI000DDCC555|nr:hypothetical protein [Nitratireductor sp. OM-1]
MPTAKLLEPARLNYLGRLWEKGVEEPIDNETAAILDENPRFKVRGFAGSTANFDDDDVITRPTTKDALGEAIREVVDALDVDEETNFTASGAPHPFAVASALGYAVSAADIKAAMGKGGTKDATANDLVDGDKGKARSGVKIKRVPRTDAAKHVAQAAQKEKASAAKAPAKQPEADPAGANDPTTEGAVEV